MNVMPINLNVSSPDKTINFGNLKLSNNLAFALEAITYVKTVLPLGAYNLEACSDSCTEASMTEMRNSWLSNFRNPELKTESAIYKMIADSAINYQIGNCGEMSCVAYCYLKYTKNLIKVDRLSILGGDHAFNVIGRDPASEVSNPNTWGIDAVVLDCWTNEYYPAYEILNRMHYFNDSIIYDPKIHTIGFLTDHSTPLHSTLKRLYAEHMQKRLEYAKLWLESLKQNQEDIITALCLQEFIETKTKAKV
jgi:hypothetical protein